jgi:hypothetical protein
MVVTRIGWIADPIPRNVVATIRSERNGAAHWRPRLVQKSEVMHRQRSAEIVRENLCICYCMSGEMTDVQGRFAVFFGKVDRRPQGWYWTGTPEVGEDFKGPITGPFESKADAIEHAIRSGAGRLH